MKRISIIQYHHDNQLAKMKSKTSQPTIHRAKRIIRVMVVILISSLAPNIIQAQIASCMPFPQSISDCDTAEMIYNFDLNNLYYEVTVPVNISEIILEVKGADGGNAGGGGNWFRHWW